MHADERAVSGEPHIAFDCVRAILDRQTAHELVKIVTRESAPAELERFQHNRMPVLENPLHAAAPVTYPEPKPPAKPKPAKQPKPASAGLVQEMLFDF
jgi:hypothetical protein